MEEKMLKLKYNELLARYNKGAEYLAKKPNDEKAMDEFNKISDELNNIIEAIPNMTEKEKLEGFDIETYSDVKDNAKAITVKNETQQSNTLSNFRDNWNIAEKLSKSSLLPAEFQGKVENVLIALGMSQKMGIDFFTIAQNLHLVKGRLSWSGSFCKTLIEKTGQYKDLDLVYTGKEGTDERACYLEATRIRDGKRIKGNPVSVKMAKNEGWWSRKDKYGNETSKWQSMTEQMLRLQSNCFLCKIIHPRGFKWCFNK